jgi:DNA modification methylase
MLATEADVVRTLATGTMSLAKVYELCQRHTDVSRDRGLEVIHGRTDTRWKRRARNALQALRQSGMAHRIDRSMWVIDGTPEQPRRAILVHTAGTLAEVELRLQDAVELLAELDDPADLILADPPYGLLRGTANGIGDSAYRRDRTKVVGGYHDVDPAAYEDFTWSWLSAAAEALRPAGQLAVITGPQRSGLVQYVAEHVGLGYVNQIAVRKEFPLRTQSRFAHAHWVINVLTKPRIKHFLTDPRRTFNVPADLPKAASGADYPQDVWLDPGRGDRPGLLRYDNALPERPVRRLVTALTNEGDHVVDPFLGSGTTARVCYELGRRCTAGDINLHAIRFAMARLLDEHIWPAEDTQCAV